MTPPVRFSNYLSACSVCSPSRAAVLTGRYPQRNGMPVCSNEQKKRWPVRYDTVGLPSGEMTIAELLKPLGYATAAYGKWHLGEPEKFSPRRQGFDEYIGRKHNFHVGKPGVWFHNEEPQGEIMFREPRRDGPSCLSVPGQPEQAASAEEAAGAPNRAEEARDNHIDPREQAGGRRSEWLRQKPASALAASCRNGSRRVARG
jgi:arylsulfatase A-like enzyme